MWYSNDMFLCMFEAEFVTLVSLKVQSGRTSLRIDVYRSIQLV